jgi:hypothetical protein
LVEAAPAIVATDARRSLTKYGRMTRYGQAPKVRETQDKTMSYANRHSLHAAERKYRKLKGWGETMARWISGTWRLATTVLFLTTALLAHHSFGAEYDATKPVTLTGVITKIDWTNPHSYFFLDVKDDKGKVANWKFEGYPPSVLSRTGWKKDVTMKVGDTVTVFGWHARDGSNWAHSREVTFASGKKLFFGPPAGTGDGGSTPAVEVK